jgi:membrane-bound lytic murein transglycosylase D
MKRIIHTCLLLWAGIISLLFARPDSTLFPVPKRLEPQVRFWMDVYTRYSDSEYVFFDPDFPDRIYSVVRLTGPASGRERALLKSTRDKIAGMLKKCSEKKNSPSDLTGDERRTCGLFPDSATATHFLRAAERLSVQNGHRESFREGLVRSGRYLDSLRVLFRRNGLPEDLAYLPHVESSFEVRAESRVGAMGMWQFMRSTGKAFGMRIDEKVDDRKDPFFSAEAAARMLKRSRDLLGNWPLAITAYNYGPAGMKKIVLNLGTDNLGKIIEQYESGAFGFATKNFYASFVASATVAEHPDRYFTDLAVDSAWAFRLVGCPADLPAGAIKKAFGVSDSLFAEWNPSLSSIVRRGGQCVPTGFRLRVPRQADDTAAFAFLASERLIPRGSYWAWCDSTSRGFFRFVDKTYFTYPAKKGRRG